MNAREARIAQRTLRLDRLETEDAIQIFIVGGDAGGEVDVPRAHAGGAEGVPESVPGEKHILSRHGRSAQMHR